MLIASSVRNALATRSFAVDHGEGSNLETYARVVNLKNKNSLLDFRATRAFECAVDDGARNPLDVGRRRPVVIERWHARAHVRVHGRDDRRRRQRREQIDRLAREQ